MNFIHLPSVGSTNSEMLRRLEAKEMLEEGTVLWTKRQTEGRGQTGNSWESEADKNISFSMLLHPVWLSPAKQFVLSETAALAIVETLEEYFPGFSIKWPNDIYHDDRKIAGMLIENRIVGTRLQDSVIGIGININQMDFLSSAPNPVSLRQLMLEKLMENEGAYPDTLQPPGATVALRAVSPELLSDIEAHMEEIPPEAFLHKVCERLILHYHEIREKGSEHIHKNYIYRLYRNEGYHPYSDAETGEEFEAKITEIAPDGRMTLEKRNGEKRSFWFKEVKFVLPCGVTKE
jgi:BirA family biotin operon repressor/biotin-[acetyl-CoA-carboxylase] ligase